MVVGELNIKHLALCLQHKKCLKVFYGTQVVGQSPKGNTSLREKVRMGVMPTGLRKGLRVCRTDALRATGEGGAVTAANKEWG